ncbi:MAG: ABC transporter ATP-binding protein [Bacilli bacterium]
MKDFLRSLKYAHQLHKGIIPLTIINAIGYSLLPYVFIYFSGHIIDMLIANNSDQSIIMTILVMAIIGLAIGVSNAITDYFIANANEDIHFRLQTRISDKTLKLPYSSLESQTTILMLRKAEEGSNGSGDFASLISYSIGGTLRSLFSLVYAIILFSNCFSSISSSNTEPIFLFLNNPFSFLIIFAVMAIGFVITFFVAKGTAKVSYEFYETNVKTNRQGAYLVRFITEGTFAKDIRVYGMAKMLMDSLSTEDEKLCKIYWHFVRKYIYYAVLSFLGSALLLFSSYFFVGGKAYFDIISVGSIITIVGAITYFSTSITNGIERFVDIQTQLKYLKCYFDFLELPEMNCDGCELPKEEPVIAFEHVSFQYPNTDSLALDDVSFTITPHKKLAVVGPNGAGKSTLIKLISRLYVPTEGKITLNGIDIQTINEDEYQGLLGILFQDFNLFAFTLKQNISCTFIGDNKKVEDSLQLVGFPYQNKRKLPQGLDTYIGSNIEEGTDFSGGERQKIAIARALYKNCPLILLDEPTSALDPKSEQEVYRSIAKLTNQKTALYISHRMSSTKFCDYIIVLDKGHIVQQGNHKSLIKQDGLYALLFNEQAKYYR